MYDYSQLTVGADPEVFFRHKDGRPQSAEGLVGGTKTAPRPIKDLPAGFFIQEDNVTAEFNVPPAKNGRAFADNISKALKYVETLASVKGLTVEISSALHFPKEQLMTPHAQTLGCEPDLNAWSGKTNPRPEPPESLRTAAGHVHVGWSNPQTKERKALSQMLDLYLGVPSVLATLPSERRSLYGKAGAIRIKDYGIEYRTLDNFWIKNKENSLFIFQQVVKAVDFIRSNQENIFELLDEHEDVIVDTINNHNMKRAVELVARFNTGLFPVSYV